MSKLKDKNLLITTLYYPVEGFPASTFVKAQVDAIKDKFNKVYVLSPIPYFPDILKNCEFIPWDFRKQAFMKDYKYDNVEVYFPRYLSLPFDYFRKKNGDFAYKTSLKCIQKNDIDFDLIHSHFTWTSGYVGVKLKEKFDKKSILTIHENRDWFLDEYNENNNKYIKTWEESDLIIRVNEKDIPKLKEYNENVINIPNGYKSDKFKKIEKKDLKKELNVPKDKKILLNVASYKIGHKNQINLIKAINELVKERQDIMLYLIGSGNDREKIENKIQELNLQDYIKVLGGKPHDEIPLWMNVADLFVLPSYSESFGVVNIEALACGTPVVSTINGGSEEIITSQDYGLLLENPENYKKLAELINQGLDKKWDIDKILDYAQKYSWENVASQIVYEYKKVL